MVVREGAMWRSGIAAILLGVCSTWLTLSRAYPLDQPGGYASPQGGEQWAPYAYSEYDAGPYRELQNQLAMEQLADLYDDEAGYYAGAGQMVNLPGLQVVENWPQESLSTGQISGVAVDDNDDVHLFHRGSRVWDKDHPLFDVNNVFTQQADGPIKEDTILQLGPDGRIMGKSGTEQFYLPHGISTDHENNLWLTDVAMHQVFKIPQGSSEPSLVLGKAFEPAQNKTDTTRFCKPTDVAVASNGDFFVADGYCNSRIVKFDAHGKYLGQFGATELSLPHSVTLAEELDMVCVADRENRRVVCFDAGLMNSESLGTMLGDLAEPAQQRIFAIAFSPYQRLLYGVTEGDDGSEQEGTGFTVDFSATGQATTVEEWSPQEQGFSTAHDLALSGEGNALYVVSLNPSRIYRFERAEYMVPDYDSEAVADYGWPDELSAALLLEELELKNILYDDVEQHAALERAAEAIAQSKKPMGMKSDEETQSGVESENEPPVAGKNQEMTENVDENTDVGNRVRVETFDKGIDVDQMNQLKEKKAAPAAEEEEKREDKIEKRSAAEEHLLM